MINSFIHFLLNPSAVWLRLDNRMRFMLSFYVVMMTIICCGLSIVPLEHVKKYVTFAADPLKSDLFLTYHGDAPLHYLLAHAVGASTLISYLAMCTFIVLLAFASIFIFSDKKKESGYDPILVFLIFCAHPISYILLTWLGHYDGITVLCTSILLFVDSPIVLSAVTCLCFTNHPSIAFISLSLIVLRYLSGSDRINVNHIVAVVVGLAAGEILLMILHHYIGIHSETRFSIIRDFTLKDWFRVNFACLPLVLYSFYFTLLIPVALMFMLFYDNNRRLYNTYALSILLFCGITSFTYDTTRVFALLSWAPTLYCLIYTWKSASSNHTKDIIYRNAIVYTATLSWIVPHLYVWDGVIYSPWFKEIGKLVFAGIFSK